MLSSVGVWLEGIFRALTVRLQVYEKSRLHRGQVGAAVYVAPNCTAALSHLDIDEKDFKGTDYRGVSGVQVLSEVVKETSSDVHLSSSNS